MSYIRVSISAAELKADIEKVTGIKLGSIMKNPDLRNDLVRDYATTVTRFVPMSDEDVAHHLNNWYISDGRVMWSRYNTKGQDIADTLYTGGRGHWHTRPEIVNHDPQSFWDDAVRPGTAEWPIFVAKATKTVKEHIDGNND